jgi:predicted amidohydrolase YtcJ
MKHYARYFLLVFLLYSCGTEKRPVVSSTVYFGGDILTMKGDSPSYAEAVLVQGDKIRFVGKKSEALERAGEGATTVDLNGKTLLPGFVDGHAHFANFGLQAIGPLLLAPPDASCKDIPTLIELLKGWNTPENRALTGWVFGNGFDDSALEEKRFPTRQDLDQVSTNVAIMITHISGRFAVVNSKGLEVLGFDENTADPEGGIIRREADGKTPNGVLEELAAIPHMFQALAPRDQASAARFFQAGQDLALSFGYTTAQEGRAMQNHELLAASAEAGTLKIDVVSCIDYAFADQYMGSVWNSRAYTNHYRIGGMKLTLDGSPQGRTAWRTLSYLIPPDGQGKEYAAYPAIPSDSTVQAILAKGFENNWQTLVHANGDAAMDLLIRTLRRNVEKYGLGDRRNTLVHGQYIREDQLDALKELDVIASLFPLHTFYWGDWHKQIVGEELGNTINPVKTALNKGVKITIEGSPQGRTAAFSTPYLTGGPGGEDDWLGELTFPQETINAFVKKVYDLNVPLNLHANGDAAVDAFITAHETVAAEDTGSDRNVTLIHAQFTREDQLAKFVEYKLTPPFYTLHTYFFADAHLTNRGKNQSMYISPMRDAIDRGILPTNHTDFVVAPLDQLFMLWSAVNRISRSGDIIGENQQITVYEGIQAMTIHVAHQYQEEDGKGSIEKGKLADFVILSEPPLKVNSDAIKEIEVLETIKEGETIFKT